MRIISGKLKGKTISFLKNLNTRPLKDSVKESIFNIIIHSNSLDIEIKDSNILDLYSGVGSFGLECISRGANKVTFIEQNKLACETLKKNLDVLEGNEKKEFLKGAEIAYESILTSFASGDLIKLKALLAPQMFSNFSDAIKLRKREKIKSEFTFIGVKESSVEKYEKIKDNLFATVKFVAEVISVKKDKDNKIIEGNPDKIKFVTDNWKFTKNINNKSPNWYLSEIISQ